MKVALLFGLEVRQALKLIIVFQPKAISRKDISGDMLVLMPILIMMGIQIFLLALIAIPKF